MKRVGYGRVSTAGQARNGTSLAEQKKQLMAAGVAEEDIYLDAYTGTKMHRPQFDACMAALEPDDEFVVCKLDRFARTATEGTGIVRDLVERGIRVNVLNMGIADNTPMGKMMVTVMLAFAEYERDMIVERTQSGKAARREADPAYTEGRPRIEADEELLRDVVRRQMAGEISAAAAASELGMSRRTYYSRRAAWCTANAVSPLRIYGVGRLVYGQRRISAEEITQEFRGDILT